MKPKLQLSGDDGNVFFILGKAKRVAQQNGMDWSEIQAKALQGDYNHVLQVLMEYFEVE